MLQLKRFQVYDKEIGSRKHKNGTHDLGKKGGKGLNGVSTNNGGVGSGKPGGKRIKFRNSIMLLEAAGRNDVEEGERTVLILQFPLTLCSCTQNNLLILCNYKNMYSPINYHEFVTPHLLKCGSPHRHCAHKGMEFLSWTMVILILHGESSFIEKILGILSL